MKKFRETVSVSLKGTTFLLKFCMSLYRIFFIFPAYFTKEANPHHATMERVIHTLTEDKDADVRAFFAEPQAYDSDGEPINDISVSFQMLSFFTYKPLCRGGNAAHSVRRVCRCAKFGYTLIISFNFFLQNCSKMWILTVLQFFHPLFPMQRSFSHKRLDSKRF